MKLPAPPPEPTVELRSSSPEVYRPEPLSARRRDDLGETGWGFWVAFTLAGAFVALVVLAKLVP